MSAEKDAFLILDSLMVTDKDLEEIKNLLKENDLPYEDILSSNVAFITSKHEQKIIGCIGIENFGEDALLRSFVIKNAFRNKGTGTQLIQRLFDECRNKHIKNIHLLTTTAEKYFLKKGFSIADRKNAPESIKNSKEFSALCPSSAVYMVKKLG